MILPPFQENIYPAKLARLFQKLSVTGDRRFALSQYRFMLVSDQCVRFLF